MGQPKPWTALRYCCVDGQESHKHLDEYAELEAEILRDMEQEQAHKNCRRRQAVSRSLSIE